MRQEFSLSVKFKAWMCEAKPNLQKLYRPECAYYFIAAGSRSHRRCVGVKTMGRLSPSLFGRLLGLPNPQELLLRLKKPSFEEKTRF